MSWRTQGHYKGLSAADREWIKSFDSEWDTKAQGRSRTDAFDHLGKPDSEPETLIPRSFLSHPQLADIPAQYTGALFAELDFRLAEVASLIARFTVPRETKAGWSIHLLLSCGRRVRAHFHDRSSAYQAYATLQELSTVFTAS